mgnify:CR=1 FL=1
MPITLPTPAEMADAPWHARDKAIGRARSLVAAYSRIVVPARPVQRTRLTEQAKAERAASYGAAVRDEARALLERIGMDPDWEAHQLALVEAVR